MIDQSKKFYWIKLRTDFFNSAEMDFLLSQKDGCQYIVLYQMLCLQTANQNGVLASQAGEFIVPFDPIKISRDTKYFSVDTVRVALELYKKLGLIYIEEGTNILKIADFSAMVGSETKAAQLKRSQREKQKEFKNKDTKLLEEKGGQCPTDVQPKSGRQCPPDVQPKMGGQCPTEIEIEIESRDREKEINTAEAVFTKKEDFSASTAIATEQSIPEKNKKIKPVIEFYENNIKPLTSQYELELLESYVEDTSADLVIYAMKKAVESNVRTLKYINGILKSWQIEGIKTLDEAVKESEKFKQNKIIKTQKSETEEEFKKRQADDYEYLKQVFGGGG